MVAHDPLEGVNEGPQVVSIEIQVVLGALGLLRRLDRVLERVALDVQHGLAEHLDQPPVRVPGEPVVVGLLGQALHRLIGQADVQHGLHHARHGELGAGPDADQQRVLMVAKLLAHLFLELPQVRGHLVGQARGDLSLFQVVPARIGGDDEAWRYRQAQVGHLSQVGALAAQQVFQVLVALGEVVDELRHCTHSSRCRATGAARADVGRLYDQHPHGLLKLSASRPLYRDSIEHYRPPATWPAGQRSVKARGSSRRCGRSLQNQPPVHIAAVTDHRHRNHLGCVIHRINDPVVARANSQPRPVTLERGARHRGGRWRRQP